MSSVDLSCVGIAAVSAASSAVMPRLARIDPSDSAMKAAAPPTRRAAQSRARLASAARSGLYSRRSCIARRISSSSGWLQSRLSQVGGEKLT